jgi:hypothetical protein
MLDAAEVDRVKRAIATLPESPVLLVIDTMARCMVGGDENSAKDVGRYIDSVDQLRHEYDGASLTVHHTGKDGDDERGSSALRGASDTMLALKPAGAGVKLECVKQKDAAPFEPWRLHLEPALESCVFRCGTSPGQLAPAERRILEEVSAAFGTKPASRTAIREAANVPKSTWHRSVKSLTDRGYLAADGTARSAPLYLTELGLAHAIPPSPNQSHGTGQQSPTETVPIGDGGTRDTNGTPQQTLNTLHAPESAATVNAPAEPSSAVESPNAEHMNVAAMFAVLVAEIRELRVAVDALTPAPATGLVDADTVAATLNTSRAWVYEHAAELGVTRLGAGERPRLRFDLEVARARFACLSSERSQTANGQPPPGISAGRAGAASRRRRSTATRLPPTGSVLRIRPREGGARAG